MVYVLVCQLHVKDDAASIDKLRAKLVEASGIYSKDKETLAWHVMQDSKDPRAFTIVERYESESVSPFSARFSLPHADPATDQSSQSVQIHHANPFYKTFGPFVGPLLDAPVSIKTFHELEGSAAVQVPKI